LLPQQQQQVSSLCLSPSMSWSQWVGGSSACGARHAGIHGCAVKVRAVVAFGWQQRVVRCIELGITAVHTLNQCASLAWFAVVSARVCECVVCWVCRPVLGEARVARVLAGQQQSTCAKCVAATAHGGVCCRRSTLLACGDCSFWWLIVAVGLACRSAHSLSVYSLSMAPLLAAAC
jgi:hypothetical protein